MRRRTRLLVSAAVTCLAAIAYPVPSAEAHDTCVSHPSDPSVVCVRNNHTVADICDRDADGHRVYAHVNVVTSGGQFQDITTGYDPNDSQPGCGQWYTSSAYPRIYDIKVCVQYEGCSAWKPA